jgi:hypothetical protein
VFVSAAAVKCTKVPRLARKLRIPGISLAYKHYQDCRTLRMVALLKNLLYPSSGPLSRCLIGCQLSGSGSGFRVWVRAGCRANTLNAGANLDWLYKCAVLRFETYRTSQTTGQICDFVNHTVITEVTPARSFITSCLGLKFVAGTHTAGRKNPKTRLYSH